MFSALTSFSPSTQHSFNHAFSCIRIREKAPPGELRCQTKILDIFSMQGRFGRPPSKRLEEIQKGWGCQKELSCKDNDGQCYVARMKIQGTSDVKQV
jgi:hypothetical protein